MSRRALWIVLAFAAGILAGRIPTGPGEGTMLAPAAALAGDATAVADGQVFVTSSGGSAYLWRRTGDRLTLLGECARTSEGKAAATFVWMPGVERES
jgi:hypothetical protein